MRTEVLGERALTTESSSVRETEMRQWLQSCIDAEDKQISRLRERIIDAMRRYQHDWPVDTREVDVRIEAGHEYRTMLGHLQKDGLPRFEERRGSQVHGAKPEYRGVPGRKGGARANPPVMSWTTAKDLQRQIERLWDRGELLRTLPGDSIFPLEVRLKRPGSRDVTERFGAVMDWAYALQAGSRAHRGYGYVVAVFPAAEDALRFIARQAEAKRVGALVSMILARYPALRDWMIRRPLTALQHDKEWERLLRVLDWFAAHLCCGLYLRQLDIPGVDTKFIEGRLGLLSDFWTSSCQPKRSIRRLVARESSPPATVCGPHPRQCGFACSIRSCT